MTNAPFKKKVIAAAVASAVMGSTAPVYAQDSSSLQEVVVTGSRIKRTDLSSPSPVAVVGSEQIEATGTVNMEQLLNELPQIIPGFTGTSNNPGTGTATIDLRGLGAVRTLILVDGKRMVPTLSDGTVDVNNMPAPLIERVEVVTGGQSATYGSDALAGAVNFILKHDYEGFEANVSYEITGEGDGDVYTASATWGTNFADGKGNIVVFASYNNRDEVLADARKFSSVTFQDGTDDAGNPALVTGGSAGTPETIYFDGLSPTGIITFNPDGSSRPWQDPEDRFNYAPDNYLQIPQDRYQVNSMAEFEINQHFVTYLDTQFVHHNTPTQLAPTPAFISSTTGFDFNFGANPFLSAATKATMAASEAVFDPYFGLPTGDGIARALFFGRRMVEVGPRQSDDDFRMYRIVAGVKGEINDRWDYDSFFIYGNVHQTNILRNDISKDKFLQALNATGTAANPRCIDASDGCVPLNIWGAGNISEDAAQFVRLNLNSFGEYEQMMGGISFTGSMPGFAAGDIGLAGGVEYREEDFQFRPDAALEAGNVLGFNATQSTVGDYNVIDFFAETDIPLLKDHQFAEKLNVNGKVRVGEYSSVGSVTSWAAGGEWVPIHGLRLRGGYSRAVRAPNVGELFLGQSQGFPAYSDPCDPASGFLNTPDDVAFCQAWGVNDPANFEQRNVQVEGVFGGNPNLDEETADSWNIGAVYEPEFIENFSITVDYFNIEIKDAIASFGGGPDSLIAGCFFSRDLTSELCQGAVRDLTGNITPVNALAANVSKLRTDGIDVQADYTFDLMDTGLSAPGTINVFYMMTYVFENGFQGNDALPFIDCAGTFGSPCGAWIPGTATPEWLSNLRTTWSNGPWQVALNWRLIDEVEDARPVRADAFGFDGDAIKDGIPPSARKIEMEHYVDINFRWDFHDHLTLSGGIDNLFDNDPEVLGDAQVQSNTEPSTYDVLGRTFWGGLKLKW